MKVELGSQIFDIKYTNIPGGLFGSHITFSEYSLDGCIREPTITDLENEILLYENNDGNMEYVQQLKEIVEQNKAKMSEW